MTSLLADLHIVEQNKHNFNESTMKLELNLVASTKIDETFLEYEDEHPRPVQMKENYLDALITETKSSLSYQLC